MPLLKDILFNKEISINIVHNSLAAGNINSSQTQQLNLLLELDLNSTGSSKDLLIQITSESDPLLLLTTVINESVYQALKSSQGLLVDFASFPHHFSELVKKCVEEQKSDVPKFILVLRSSGTDFGAPCESNLGRISLEVVELNAFKHLCHLSISLTSASIQNKLVHLANGIKTLKCNLTSEKETASHEIHSLKNERDSLQKELAKRAQEVESAQEEMRRRIDLETERQKVILKEEKETYIKKISESDRKTARERRDQELKFEEKFNELKTENSVLKKKNAELSTHNKWIDENLRESKFKLKELEEKEERHLKELNEMSNEREDLRRKLNSSQNTIREQESQLYHQKNSLQEKERLRLSQAQEIESLTEERVSVMKHLRSLKEKLQASEDKHEYVTREFNKSLDVLRQFKRKLAAVDEEKSVLKQELESFRNKFQEKEERLKCLEESDRNLTRQVPDLERQLKDSQKCLEEAGLKIKEQEHTLRSNDNVITWLNKQLNELESMGAAARKAPLAEAFLNPHHQRVKISNSAPLGNLPHSINSAPGSHSVPGFMPITNTSTPISAYSGSMNAMGTGKIHSLSSVHPKFSVEPPIPEENSSPDQDQENNRDLNQYIQSNARPMQVRGLLRSNAVKELDDVKKNEPKNAPTKKVGPKRTTKKPLESIRDKNPTKTTVKHADYFGAR